MEKRTVSLLFIILVGVIAIGLAGCATTTTVSAPAKTMPEMLQEAGFKAYPAETSQEMAYMKACPKNTLMIHTRAGTVVYCFVDLASNSMYMGNETAYRRLQDLLGRKEQKIQEQRMESDPQFWTLWGHKFGG